MRWLSRWFLRSYLVDLATQGGALTVTVFLFGAYREAESFLSANRFSVLVVLVIHCLLHLIAALATTDAEALEELRQRHLDDD